jgi:hypothetical protein
MARAVEYWDQWMPVVTPSLGLETDMKQLDRLCREAGRPNMPVTAFLWELDEPLLDRCAELGVERCVVYLYPKRIDMVEPFLAKLKNVAERIGNDLA